MPDRGPYVQIATFCEDITRRPETGNMSIINCVATIKGQMPPGTPPPGAVPMISISHLKLAVSLWAGELAGNFTITVRPEPPEGVTLPPGFMLVDDNVDVTLTAGDGVDLDLVYSGPLVGSGRYWFTIFVSGGPDNEAERQVTRVPLTVLIPALTVS